MEPTVLLLHSIQSGDQPPPPQRACFGRDELIEKIVGFAEKLTPIALIGPGGIGKTSIALVVLHHSRIKQRFGENRYFIHCDKLLPSRPHFLSQLSKVIGAGVDNPEDLTPLRPALSSKEMILFLDNAESVLDPRGTNGREIYAVVEELSRFDNIFLCLTSRISTIPPVCKRLDIPTLSMDAASRTFYEIYDSDERPDLVNGILKRLDFHPLSIVLLATVAHQNRWDANRLTKEWERRRTGVLHTQHDSSLAATIEVSLASPMFQELGPDARGLLGVVAFFPQGVAENNMDWLFPSLPNGMDILDKFCTLSLTSRSNGFVTMLAPLRDYLCPKDPASSPLLHTAKVHYFNRLSVFVNPGDPGFQEGRWIESEDVNAEQLLDAFIPIDANSVDPRDSCDILSACAGFMRHLYWHKKRLVVLGPKIEKLPDTNHSKPECLFELSRLFDSVGNRAEYKRLLIHVLELWRRQEDHLNVAETLRFISDANRWLCLYDEGIQQATEALEIYKRLGNTYGEGCTWLGLARLLYGDKRFGAAEEAALRGIDLLTDERGPWPACSCYRLLGDVCRSKGEIEKAIGHYETALGIATSFDWHEHLFWNHYSLAGLFFDERRLDDAHAHAERAKSHAVNDPYHLGRAMELQARFWYIECRLDEAKSEALRASGVYEGIGAAKGVEDCQVILRDIGEKAKTLAASGETLETVLLPTP